jgi:hypothetical protein
MSSDGDGKHGNLTLLRGGQWGRWTSSRTGGKRLRLQVPVQAQDALDRAMQEEFAQAEGEDGAVPSRGVQEIRQCTAWPWRTLARRFWEMRAAGVPLATALAIIRAFERWIVRLYNGSLDRAA